MKKQIYFPKRIPEPKEMEEEDMKAFEMLSKNFSKQWFLPLIDDMVTRTKISKNSSLDIIDIACGPGALSKELGDYFSKSKIVGVDVSSPALDMARKSCVDLSNVSFKESSVESLHYGENTFDIIICKDSVHHFPNLKKALKEMLRITKPGGYIYIQDLRRDLPMYLLNRAMGRENTMQKLQYYSARAAYTKEEIKKLLETFKGVKYTLTTRQAEERLKRRYHLDETNFQRLRESFQARYVLVIKKP